MDREIRDSYTLTVVATDQDEPFNIGITTVNITVLDFNDNSPLWTQTVYEANISESSGIGTFVSMVRI